jgi:hypothetical protein
MPTNPYLTSNPNDNPKAFGPNPIGTLPPRNDRQALGIYNLSNPPEVAPTPTITNVPSTIPMPTEDIKAITTLPNNPSTTAAGDVTRYGSMAEDIASEQKKIDDARTEKETSKSDITKLITDLGNVESTVDRTQQAESKKVVKDLTQDIRSEQLATRERIRQVERTFGGSPAGLADEIGRIQSEASYSQANKMLSLAIATDNFELFKDTADRQVELKTADIKAKLDAKKFIYDDIKDTLTKSEDRVWDAKITAEERAYEKTKQDLTNVNDVKKKLFELGVKPSQDIINALGNAKNLDEAMRIPGLSDLLAKAHNEIVDVDGTKMIVNKITSKASYVAGGASNIPANATPEVKGLAATGNLVGGFRSVAAEKSFKQNVKDLAAKNDEKGLAEMIVGQALSNIATPEIKKRAVGGFYLAIELTKMQKLLEEYEAKGGRTNILSGSIQDVKQRLGTQGDPELAKLGAQMTIQLDNLARARTGAVITENEEKLYGKILPSTGKTLALNTALITGLKESLMGDVESNLRFEITTTGLDMLKASLPDVFDSTDPFLDNFTPEKISESLDNKDYFNQL